MPKANSGDASHDREHHYDRVIAAATYRRQRAAAGHGYGFELPPSLRVREVA
jgi:hypothetical protein